MEDIVLRVIFSFIAALIIFVSTLPASSNNPVGEAMKAKSWAQKQGIRSTDIVMVVDFAKHSYEKRLYIVDTKTGQIIYSTWATHGVGSGAGPYATQFSNIPNSKMSSLGYFITQETYIGKNGKSLRIHGLQSTNNKACERAIVIHGAGYIGDGKTGTSWGCFAVPYADIQQVIGLLKSGSLIVAVT